MKNNINSLKFTNSTGDTFQINEAALNVLLANRQLLTDDPEAGGIMIGRFIRGTNNVVVDKVTEPTSKDRRSRLRFFRYNFFHLQFANDIWRKSRGRVNYLGEWHTHPQRIPVPSPVDIANWQRKIREDKYDGEHLYFVIVGTEIITAWEGNKSDNSIKKLDAHYIN